MDVTVDRGTRTELTRWIEEAQHMLALLTELLDENERFRLEAARNGQEGERLRQELGAMRLEVDLLKAERREMAGALRRFMVDMAPFANE